MASLSGKAPGTTFKDLLHIYDGDDNEGLVSTLKTMFDGDGAATNLQLSTANVNINNHDGATGLMLNGTLVTSSAAEINKLNGLTPGTVTTAKFVLVDTNKDISGFRNITATGTITAANFIGSGNVQIGDAPADTLALNATITTNLIFEGSSANDHELTLSPGNPSADRTLTLPDETGTIATQAHVTTQVNNLIDSAPSALNTLNELAAALNDDANFGSTVTTSLAAKAPLASPTFTGTVSVSGAQVIDKTNTEAFLVRKASAGGDVMAVDTTNNLVILPVNTNSTSNKLRFVGTSNSHIYGEGYNAYWTATMWHYVQSRDGLMHQNADASKYIELRHDVNGNNRIASNMSDFNIYAGNAGVFGFLTSGSTYAYKAIESVYTDNNTSGLKLNYRTGGTDTTAITITSAGLVGIGTTAPAYDLQIFNSVGATMKLSGDALADTKIIHFGNTGTVYNHHSITANGNDGIMKIGTLVDGAGFSIELRTKNRVRFKLDDHAKISLSNNDNGTGNTVFGKNVGENNYDQILDSGTDYNVFIGEEVVNGGTLDNATDNVGVGYKSLYSLTQGDDNTAVGYQSGFSLTTGSENTYLGWKAGVTTADGGQNVAIGKSSLLSNVSGYSNTAVGYSVLGSATGGANTSVGKGSSSATTSGQYNTVVGANAFYYSQTGSNATAIGYQSMHGVSGNTHSNNTAVGWRSMYSITTGSTNTAIGKEALYSETGGGYLVAIGEQAMYSQNANGAVYNTAIGSNASYYNVNGQQNTSVGYNAMQGSSGNSNSYNTAVGYNSLLTVSTGAANTAIGYRSLELLTTGGNNTGLGGRALNSQTTASQNTAVGQQALRYNQTGGNNVSVGFEALRGVSGNSHNDNTAVGVQSMKSITTGGSNVSLGHQSLYSNTIGGNNVSLGVGSMYTNTNSSHTVAIGWRALNQLNGGASNNAIGTSSQRYNETGIQNTSFGYQALMGSSGNSHNYNTAIGASSQLVMTGSSNSSLGSSTLSNATSANYNVAVGSMALNELTTGDSNIGIGLSASRYNETGADNVAIGFEALKGVSGNSHSNNTAIGYESMKGTTTGNKNVAVGTSSLSASTTSIGNTATGYHALKDVTTGGYNVSMGYLALANADGAENSNTALGAFSAMDMDNDGSIENTYVGIYAGMGGTGLVTNNTVVGGYAFRRIGDNNATYNTAMGKFSMGAVWAGASNYNTAIGGATLNGAMNGAHYNTALGYAALRSITTGDNNIGIGSAGGLNITEGSSNIAIGYECGNDMTTTSNTVLIGYRAGYEINDTGANGTVAIGYQALEDLTSGHSSTALGYRAGKNLTTGYQNTYLGFNAGLSSDVGLFNTAVGAEAYNDAVGDMRSNTVVGAVAGGFANVNSDNNTVLGAWALRNGTGQISENVVIGSEACDGLGTNNPSMVKCTFIGRQSGSGTWGSNGVNYNTAVGYNTMPGGLDGAQHNVTVGYFTLASLTTGDSNIALGSFSLNDLVSGSNNIAIGHNAGANATGSNSLSIGTNANYNLTSGANQISIGHEAGMALTTAANSTFIGYHAGRTITGGNNVAIGDRAFANTDSTDNSSGALASNMNVAVGNFAMGGAINNTVTGAVAIGYYALGSAACGTSASGGVYIGKRANLYNGGGQNIAIGGDAMMDANGTETGNVAIGVACMDNVDNNASDFNTVVGNYAVRGGTGTYAENVAMGYEVHDGTGNQDVSREVMLGRHAGGGTLAGSCLGSIGIGHGALSANNRDSNYNIAVGVWSGNVITTGNNNICIGVDSNPSAADGGNQIVIGSSTTGLGNNYAVIGNANVTRLYVASDGAGVLYANGTIQTSDKRLKENIKDTDLGLDFINKLRPVKYNYIKDKQDGKTKYGIIAQEVQEVLKESNNEDFAGIKDSDEYLGADYNQFIAPLMKAVQELSTRIVQLEKQLEDK